MAVEMNTNVETVCKQAITPGPMFKINLRRAAAENNGIYQGKRNTAAQVQVDDQGRIIKYTQSDPRHITATIFSYNEKGDIIQQIRDDGDDGKYEQIYNFNCVYDENDNLISHEETMWSKIKNGFNNFYHHAPIFH